MNKHFWKYQKTEDWYKSFFIPFPKSSKAWANIFRLKFFSFSTSVYKLKSIQLLNVSACYVRICDKIKISRARIHTLVL